MLSTTMWRFKLAHMLFEGALEIQRIENHVCVFGQPAQSNKVNVEGIPLLAALHLPSASSESPPKTKAASS